MGWRLRKRRFEECLYMIWLLDCARCFLPQSLTNSLVQIIYRSMW